MRSQIATIIDYLSLGIRVYFSQRKGVKLFSCDQTACNSTIIYEDISHKTVSGFPALNILRLTYLRWFSQTTFTRFCPILTPYPSTHTLQIFDGILLLKNKGKSAFFQYHSTNVVFECPHFL